MFSWQKDIFLKKLNTDFEVMIQTIERKRNELQVKIFAAYDSHIEKAQNLQVGLQALKESIDDIKQAEAKVDIEFVTLNKAIGQRIKDISKHMDIDIKGNELDLLNSCFINDPYSKIERQLARLDFFPVPQQRLLDLTAMFNQSKIIKPDHITVNFLTAIIPKNLVKLSLLYQHSNEMAIARKEYKRWEQL